MEYPLPVMRMMMRRVTAHLLWIVRSSGKLGCVPIVPTPSHACSQECLQFMEMHFLFFFLLLFVSWEKPPPDRPCSPIGPA